MLGQNPRTAQAPPDPEVVEPALMTVAQAAAALGWSDKQVRSALDRNVLAGFKPGGLDGSRWAVYRWSVEELAGGQRGLDPEALAGKFRRWTRLRSELQVLEAEAAKLGLEIEDALRQSTICRDGGAR
jgi:hypothetical protein